MHKSVPALWSTGRKKSVDQLNYVSWLHRSKWGKKYDTQT